MTLRRPTKKGSIRTRPIKPIYVPFTNSQYLWMVDKMTFEVLGISLNTLSVIAGAVTSILSVGLYALLVVLYGQQRDILKRQTELAESSRRALPRVRTYFLYSCIDKVKFEQSTGEKLDIPGYPETYAGFVAYVSNNGKGYAKDVRAELVIKSPNMQYSATRALSHTTNMDQIAFNNHGGTLSPEEGEVTMVTGFVFAKDDLSKEIEKSGITVGDSVAPTELLWMLYKLDESPVQIAIFVHYKDGTGVREPIQLLTTEFDLSKQVDIRTAYEWGTPVTDADIEPIFEHS